jgi:hypothetical protein
MMRTEKDKMLVGELYDASASEIQAELAATHRWLVLHASLDMAPSERRSLLLERLGRCRRRCRDPVALSTAIAGSMR